VIVRRADMLGARGAGVRVRPLGRHDIIDLRDALAKGKAAETTRRLFPRSLPSMLDWFDQLQSAKEMSPFAIVVDRAFIGYCALRPPIYSGRELVIAIFDPRYQAKGFGTYAVRELCAFGFGVLKLPRIELGVYPSNFPAISCYLRCGFREEAVLRRFVYHEGSWVDVTLMSLLRSEWRNALTKFN
jgi:RimJ/RimL family protein N-acetyltransferase